MKRQRRRVGDVLRIDLGAGFHTYARVLPEASFAFYDCRVGRDASLPEILASQILFQIAVMNHAVTTGDEEGMTPFSLSGFKGKQAFLSKVDGNKFRLRKRIFYRNSFARHLSALLAPDLGGTRIEAHFAMSFFVRGFMIVWFGFLALFEISAIVTTARALLIPGRHLNTDECMLLVVPTAMLIFGWLLVSLGLRLSRKAEREMIEFVEHTLAARRLPD